MRIPDTPVVDQDGRELHFYSDLVKGRTVAINFIFTSCPSVCPRLSATFREVQRRLGDRAGRDVALISISVDPTTDVPARLKAHAEKSGAAAGWTFVTGRKTDIDPLLRALGAMTGDAADHTGNFVYTTCSGICPVGTANLAKVRQYLGDRVGRQVVMLSISVDPERDTPETLKAFAERHHAGPGWYFLTGDKESVESVLRKLGGYVQAKEQHNDLLILGNEATGEWMKLFVMTRPSEIAAAVEKLMAHEKRA